MATRGRQAQASERPGTGSGRRAERAEQRAALSRAQLLDAAEEVFSRRGYHGATLRDVADLAEFSVGSVYSFFDSKEDLYANVFVRRGDDFVLALEQAVGTGSPMQQLHAMVDTEIGFFRRHPGFGRLYLRSARIGGLPSAPQLVEEVVAGNVERAMAIQTDVIERGQADGIFRAGDPRLLARLFSGLISTFQSFDPQIGVSDPETPSLAGAGAQIAVPERPTLELATLHQMVEAAFGRGEPR